ncbi:MAG: hypothetical protein KatS3mg038_3231 [Candidatus Kapaibacterium sp.]|nr:MAG: hypothetical protein KatS3mg038_3094 [Candidatus Kapabacteria bacterium]GIV52710.1 MAG: hypothetical protein KatS3mg038_3231 [Candidatus Kapabacteria bacterium]
MLACFDVHGDHLCYGSCGLPAGNRAFFFRSGLMCWTIDIPEGAVQPAAPRHVVALVSRAPEIEPYVVVSSWVLRKRADRQFRRHGRRRATVRCVSIERIYLHADAGEHQEWVAGRYGVPVMRASAHAPIVVGDSYVRVGRDLVLGIDCATQETAGGLRRLSYRRHAAEISELVGRKLRAWT